MYLLSRIIRRLRFRKSLKGDESRNVVDGMVKARQLYKRLTVVAHPDKNPEKEKIAEELMARVVANRFNYAELLLIEKEVQNKLGK